jgi:hypothetical protein
MKALAWFFAAACALGACRTETAEEPAGSSLNRIEKLTAARAWRVLDGGATVGWVVLYSDPSAPDDPAKHYFSVRNTFQQELGSLDGLGRSWKFTPHQRDAKLLGSGTVLEGARRILGLGPDSALEELSLDALRAASSAPKR